MKGRTEAFSNLSHRERDCTGYRIHCSNHQNSRVKDELARVIKFSSGLDLNKLENTAYTNTNYVKHGRLIFGPNKAPTRSMRNTAKREPTNATTGRSPELPIRVRTRVSTPPVQASGGPSTPR
ncbi:hypothetical protein N7467_005695 [Penicillium canescens]|nr:hypothetical protein N7467_005695 [Penicillium canescens]